MQVYFYVIFILITPLSIVAMQRSLDDSHLGLSSSLSNTERRKSLSVLTSKAVEIRKKLEAHLQNNQTPEAQRKIIEQTVQDLNTVLDKSKDYSKQQ